MGDKGEIHYRGGGGMAESAGKEPGLLAEFIWKKDLAHEFRVSERTIERWVRLRLLPAPLKLGRTSIFHVPTVKKDLVDQTSDKIRWRSRKIRRRSRKPA